MIEDKIPNDKGGLIVEPAHINVIFTEGSGSVLSVLMPPIEDIAEIDRLKVAQFSIDEVMIRNSAISGSAFSVELSEQLKKQSLHAYSPVFNNRLANLAQLAGDRDLEERFLKKAVELSGESYFFDRLGENLILQERFADAEKLFSERNLEKDLHANLRLAFFHVKRSDFSAASKILNRAVEIDPLDYSSRLFQGSLSLVAGDPLSAIRVFRIAEEVRPNSSVLHANFSIAYASLGNYDRALGFAKRAVALDPLNKNALGLLADLSFRQKCNDDAIPALRYFLGFEQKQPQIWAQLARALLEIGSFDEAISALRRQGSLVDSPEIWNNLGVAYHRKGRATSQKALEAFAYAASNKWNVHERVSVVALRNFCAMLVTQGEHERVISATNSVVKNSELTRLALQDIEVSDLFAFRILSLSHIGHREQAVELAEALLDVPNGNSSLKAWVAAWAIAFYALREDPRASVLSERFVGLFWEPEVKKAGRADMLVNNIAFAYAELGDLARADEYLRLVSNRIHKDPYPTATLGLLHLRRGHEDRGTHLYEEAIHLALGASDKARIRQKMHLELAQFKYRDNLSAARRHLEKAIAITGGAPELTERARVMRATLGKLIS
ncbi:tetratricopeptide repeat protein [Burkholderia ambifaria]|uniref:tetratricopeptide repeat protein n=1 Tax=Burkholderia ambifaria TaxID=152480 RepID=UPI001B932682|nr:tetratricopeptide repeat protein [Burkholderia ambifaria]MBR8064354.1 tetratricopeptide repeat protein [Burkholderia ambifaria]